MKRMDEEERSFELIREKCEFFLEVGESYFCPSREWGVVEGENNKWIN